MLHSVAICSLLGLASAHFTLNYPGARGFDEDKLGTFPCGGQDTPSSNRTNWPTSGGSIQLDMEHDRVAVQAFLGLGNNVGESFNTIIYPLSLQQGFGKFCINSVSIPSNLNITEGQNATIQVITTNEDGGGLYNCADITFTKDDGSKSECVNGTGVSAVPFTGSAKLANQTTEDSLSGGSAGSSSSTGGSVAPTAMAGLKVVVGGALGFAAFL